MKSRIIDSFPTMFSTPPKTKFRVIFIFSSACALDLDRPKILSFGKGLKVCDEINHGIVWSFHMKKTDYSKVKSFSPDQSVQTVQLDQGQYILQMH